MNKSLKQPTKTADINFMNQSVIHNFKKSLELNKEDGDVVIKATEDEDKFYKNSSEDGEKVRIE